jgi:hypothetical protein
MILRNIYMVNRISEEKKYLYFCLSSEMNNNARNKIGDILKHEIKSIKRQNNNGLFSK